jgi:oxygen-independent coproporphyrinogen-3 oxidase
VENISSEIDRHFKSHPGWGIKTVYVGGGTPSTLNTADIDLLLNTIRRIGPDAEEVTFEVNPHFDDVPKIPGLFRGGVNRLSIGVQTFNDTELAIAGRLHSADDARHFLRECRDAGFENISIDLIYGLPEQTVETFETTLKETIDFGPEHISLYALSVDPGSRLGRLPKGMLTGLNLPDGDMQADMYELARNLLKSSGYTQYEISNFAKPGFHCRHNLTYWFGQDYLGFGPGATSYIEGTRYRRLSDVDAYLAALRTGRNTVEYLESLSTQRAAAEALVMGLRLADGINRRTIETRFGVRLTDLCGDVLDKYEEQGLLKMDGENIRLTDRAYFVSNAIFRDIIR